MLCHDVLPPLVIDLSPYWRFLLRALIYRVVADHLTKPRQPRVNADEPLPAGRRVGNPTRPSCLTPSRRSRSRGSTTATSSFLRAATHCKHNVSMPHVLVRDVPDDVHAALQRKAVHHHQSLQQYLAVELRHLAERRSISEVLDEVEAQHGGHVGFAAAVTDLDEERSQR